VSFPFFFFSLSLLLIPSFFRACSRATDRRNSFSFFFFFFPPLFFLPHFPRDIDRHKSEEEAGEAPFFFLPLFFFFSFLLFLPSSFKRWREGTFFFASSENRKKDEDVPPFLFFPFLFPSIRPRGFTIARENGLFSPLSSSPAYPTGRRRSRQKLCAPFSPFFPFLPLSGNRRLNVEIIDRQDFLFPFFSSFPFPPST